MGRVGEILLKMLSTGGGALVSTKAGIGTSLEKTSPARKGSVPGAEFAYSKSENNTRYFVLTHFT